MWLEMAGPSRCSRQAILSDRPGKAPWFCHDDGAAINRCGGSPLVWSGAGLGFARPGRRRHRRGHVGRDDFVASAAYQPEPAAVAAARRFVRETLEEWIAARGDGDGRGLVDDAVLLTSELVTNAVVHAGTAVQVVCRLAGEEVEVVVSDGDPGRMVPEPRQQEVVPAERTGGRGLLLPASLASAWGVTYGRAAKAVWFRMGVSGQAAVLDDAGGAEAGAAGGLNGAAADQAVLTAALRHAPAAVNGSARPARAEAGDMGQETPGPAGDEGYERLLRSAVDSARALLGADAAYAMLPDEDGELALRAAAGHISAPDGEDARRSAPAAAWPRLAAASALAGAAPSVVAAPFVVDGRVVGLLAAASAAPGRFGDDDVVRLQRLADRCGPALERARLADVERMRRGRIGALALARGLLAGRVAHDDALALAARAAVPRLASWCAVLLASDGALRPVLVRHADQERIPALTVMLDRALAPGGPAADGWPPVVPSGGLPGAPAPAWRWPLAATDPAGAPGAGAPVWDDVCCFPLAPDGRAGVFAIGCGRGERLPREVVELAADLACRLGMALAAPVRPVRKQSAGRKSAPAARESAAVGLPAGR